MEDKDLSTLPRQYNNCWWPGYSRSQDIGSNGIDIILLEYSAFNTRRTNCTIFKHISVIDVLNIPSECTVKWIPQCLINDKPTLVQVIVWGCEGPEPMLIKFCDFVWRQGANELKQIHSQQNW